MVSVERSWAKVPVLVLISGTGTNMEGLVRYSLADPNCPYAVSKVIADRPCIGLERAARLGITAIEFQRRDPEFNEKLQKAAADQDVIVLAGYLSILPSAFIKAHKGRIINIHPSLLPAFTGLHTHQRAIDAGCKFAGATVHRVTAELDVGPILEQAVVPVLPGDSAQLLAERVLVQEHAIYPRAVERLLTTG